jgi:hypothetical protein
LHVNQHNETLHPAHSFGTKQKEEERTNTFKKSIQRECRYGKRHSGGEVIRILNPYLIVTFPLRIVKLFIHFNCIFIQFYLQRFLCNGMASSASSAVMYCREQASSSRSFANATLDLLLWCCRHAPPNELQRFEDAQGL